MTPPLPASASRSSEGTIKAGTPVYAFGYYGGKLSHLKRLLPLLPSANVQTYIEPFSGSAAVLLNRPPSPVEVYNDLDDDVVTFFRVLREAPDELIRLIELTPYSRAEFTLACKRHADLPDMERARRFYVRINQSRSNVPTATSGQWSYAVTTTNRGMASAISGWQSTIGRLNQVSERLRNVQIECLPALDCIGRYDSPKSFFYVDPPYVLDTRNSHEACYVHEMTNTQHLELAASLRACQGKVALSGYDSDLYYDLFPDWHVTRLAARAVSSSPSKALKQEVLWTNYDPADVHSLASMPLFAVLTPDTRTGDTP